jgi:hypothetical protein
VTGPAAEDLRSAARAAQELLARVPDFSAPVPAMSGDVRDVVLHIAACLQWYAHDLVAGPTEAVGPTPEWPADAAPADLVRELGISAEVLARVVTLAGPDDRAWHPWGLPDATGIAAIGIAELLLHTDDVAAGVGLAWTPPAGPVAAALARLFPDAPADGDPWSALRWATGRGDLPGRPRVTDWRYALTPPVAREEPPVTAALSPAPSSRP